MPVHYPDLLAYNINLLCYKDMLKTVNNGNKTIL
jgi:hypothetical protein